MARTRTTGPGHNSGDLTDDEKSALQHKHIVDIITKQKAADKIKATYDEARAEVNNSFAAMKGDLGYSRKQIEEIIAALSLTETAFRNNENARAKRLALSGLPVGAQLDMFAGDTVDDALEAEANGYRAGRRADDRDPPSTVAPMFRTDWLRGWSRGQDENSAQFLVAQAVIDARAAADAPPEPEAPDVDEDEAIDDAARKLRRQGFTKRAADADAELETA